MNQLVLVAIDPGYRDISALEWAIEWATATGQELRVVSGFEVQQAEMSPQFHDEMLEEAHMLIDAKIDAVERGQRVKASSRIIEGDPAQVVVDAVRTEDPSIVVLGAKGEVGNENLAIDGVGHQILTKLVRPVAVARHIGGPIRSGHIVVGFDAAQNESGALKWALDAAGGTGSRLTVLREGTQDEEAVRADTRTISDLAQGRVDLELRFSEDDHVETLCELARANDASMIVAGSKGAGRLLELLSGDDGARLLELTDRPVVIIHED